MRNAPLGSVSQIRLPRWFVATWPRPFPVVLHSRVSSACLAFGYFGPTRKCGGRVMFAIVRSHGRDRACFGAFGQGDRRGNRDRVADGQASRSYGDV